MASTLYLILPILFILIISTIPVTCTSYDSETIHGALAKITPNSWSAFHSLEFPAPLDKSYCGASHLIPSLQTQSDLELVQVRIKFSSLVSTVAVRWHYHFQVAREDTYSS